MIVSVKNRRSIEMSTTPRLSSLLAAHTAGKVIEFNSDVFGDSLVVSWRLNDEERYDFAKIQVQGAWHWQAPPAKWYSDSHTPRPRTRKAYFS